jgi:hypothetical protein
MVMAALALHAQAADAQAAESVPYDQVPEAVLATARPLVANGRFGLVERERDDKGRMVYTIYFLDAGGARRVLYITEDGTLLERWYL